MIGSGDSKSKKKIRGINDASVVLIFLTLLLAIVFVLDEIGADNIDHIEENIQISSKEPRIATLEMFVTEIEEQTGLEEAENAIISSDVFEKFEEIYQEHLETKSDNESDFVIYFEDEQGNLLKLTEKPCFGSGNATVNGRRCNE